MKRSLSFILLLGGVTVSLAVCYIPDPVYWNCASLPGPYSPPTCINLYSGFVPSVKTQYDGSGVPASNASATYSMVRPSAGGYCGFVCSGVYQYYYQAWKIGSGPCSTGAGPTHIRPAS